ncbi:MAG: hypothetical protein GQ534_05915 [Candidatus Delongbacteria bacterium]|nr:hypothetical protein [Candidatus Delongbacteria bacterium]
MKNHIIIILVTSVLILTAQEFSRGQVDFTIRDEYKKSLRFSKELQSQIFTEFNYQDLNYGSEKVRELKEEIKVIEFLWNVAKDSITIDLDYIHIGYPLLYKDILEKQIEVFNSSPEWQKHLVDREKKKTPSWSQDHDLIRKIMLEGKVYNALDDLLIKFGYKIKSISVEKIGYASQKDIDKHGLKYDKKVYKDVPVPFMVWITVEKIAEK